jgi:lipopolysaccharide transport system permease protein
VSAPGSVREGTPVTVLEPRRGLASFGLRDLWEYRELLYFLVWRDVKVRYKQTVLGAAWAILQPTLTMVVFTIFFGRLAGISSEGVPYPIFSYAALLPWTFFAQGLTQSSNSLVGSSHLITKVYFPRIVIPLATIVAGLVDFALAFLVLLGLMAFYGVVPTTAVLALPLLLALTFAVALGAGTWLAALNVEYRDVHFVVPFFVQIWLFVSPVIYPARTVVAKIEGLGLPGWLYGLNPMVGVVEGFRWALLGIGTPPASIVWASAGVAAVMLVSGIAYFRRVERTFADVV